MRWPIEDYQKQVVRFGISRGAAGLWLDPGLGKTSCSLMIYKLLRAKSYVRGTLVIAPLRAAVSVWPGEATKWDDFHDLKVAVLHGPDKASFLAEKHDIYVINPEGLPWLFAALEKVKVWPFDMLVIDESTKFKNRDTQRFKLLSTYINKFKRRYALTGTPSPNGLIDLFAQIFLLDGGIALGRYITHYRSRFFEQIPPLEYQIYVPKPGAERQIYKRLEGLVIRMAEEDYLKLPPFRYNDILVELDGKSRKSYNDMEKNLLAYLDSGRVDAVNAAVAVNKCLQLTGGGVYDGQKGIHEVHTAKTEALKELIAELNGKPLMIAYGFQHELIRIKQALGKDIPHIGGGVSTKRGLEIENLWNKGLLPELLVHPASVSHGLNLQGAACHLCYYSFTWNLEDYEQLIKRLHRKGQTQRVTVHRLIAKNTIDEAVMASLESKGRVQDRLLDAIREQTKKRFKR
jgi:SNF2 family DNA or RNA helicase